MNRHQVPEEHFDAEGSRHSLHRVWDWTGSGWGFVERWLYDVAPEPHPLIVAMLTEAEERTREARQAEVARQLAAVDREFARIRKPTNPEHAEQEG